MELIESINEAVQNAEQFNRIVRNSDSEAFRRFSQFFHWYYFSNLDIFAPSKFIGYRNTNIENYVGEGTGTDTQRVLSKWFSKVQPKSPYYNKLREKLKAYGQGLGKIVGKKTFEGTGGIYLLSEKYATSKELDEKGQRLLGFLIKRIKNVEPGDSSTYVGYKVVHTELGLNLRGHTWGRSLKSQGLSSLADWTEAEGKPGITGIIIDIGKGTPGPGYFHLFGKSEDDFAWWTEQVRKSKEYDWSPYLPFSELPQPPKAADLNAPARREEITTYRIIRDTNLSRRVKALHHYKCQLCGYSMILSDGSYYAEAHHIRPLGNPHKGPDVIGNILCLCPNHHAEMDYGVSKINPSRLNKLDGHMVDIDYIDYHNENIFKNKP